MFFTILINSDADAASALRRLNNDGYGQIAVPFKGIGFTGGLTDKGLPVYVCGNAWITGAPSPIQQITASGSTEIVLCVCTLLRAIGFPSVRMAT